MRVIEMIIDRITGKAPKGAKRSKEWRKVRDKYIAENPECAVCGRTDNLVAHHVIPFYIAPDLELQRSNLVTLCTKGNYGIRNCHQLIGHLGFWRRFNPVIHQDIAVWKRKLRGKIKTRSSQ